MAGPMAMAHDRLTLYWQTSGEICKEALAQASIPLKPWPQVYKHDGFQVQLRIIQPFCLPDRELFHIHRSNHHAC